MAKLLGGTQVYGNATINSYLVVSGNADLSGGNVSIGSGNTTVTSITITATGNSYQASPTVTILAPTTLYGATATANVSLGVVAIAANIGGGTGYAVNNVLTAVGNAGVISNAQFIVTSVNSGAITGLSVYLNAGTYYWANTQPLTFTGGAGTGANAFVYYGLNTPTITYNGVGYVEPATVTFSGGSPAVNGTGYPLIGTTANVRALANNLDFYAPNNTSLLRLQGQNGAGGYATNGITPALTILAPQSNYGTTVINSSSQLYIVSRTAGGTISLQTSGADPTNSTGSGVTQFAVSGTPSAVNYVQVTGGTTGVGPTISAQGSDTNVYLNLVGKGGGGVSTLYYHNIGSYYTNYLSVSGTNSGAPTIQALSFTNANVDISFVPKGTGNVTTASPLTVTNANVSTGTGTGALIVAGGAGIAGDVNIGANLTYGTVPILESSRTVTSIGTAPVAIDWFASTAYRSAKYVVSTTDVTNSQYQTVEVILVQDGTASTITSYGEVTTGSSTRMTFTSNITSGNVILWGTGVSANNTVKLARILIPT